MKSAVAIIALAFSMSAFAVFTTLSSEWTKGQYRYCKYSDGRIITVDVVALCPLSLN